jgi:hypothetical protein
MYAFNNSSQNMLTAVNSGFWDVVSLLQRCWHKLYVSANCSSRVTRKSKIVLKTQFYCKFNKIKIGYMVLDRRTHNIKIIIYIRLIEEYLM